MPNQRHNPLPNVGGHKTGVKGPKHDSLNEKCPNWPGTPGKSGPNRANGIKKVRTHPKSKGL